MNNITKLLPQDIEAELSILGGVLIDNSALHRVMERITGSDFYRDKHRIIFEKMMEIDGRGEPIDIITLSAGLKMSGKLNEVGGPAYVASLTDGVATAANIGYYAQLVKDHAIRRSVITAATEIVSEGYEAQKPASEYVAYADSLLFQVTDGKVKPTFTPMSDLVKGSFVTMEALYERKEAITGVPSGFDDLDYLTAGFQNSDLIIIAGRPSMGKTALALNIACNASKEMLEGVGAIFSLEMSKEQLAMRMLCSEAKVPLQRVRTGHFTDSDWPKLTRAAGFLKEMPIEIDDTAAISVMEMRAKARRLHANRGLKWIIVDYLQLMRGDSKTENRNNEIGEISRGLKALAKELNVPVIALSQLSRAVEQRGGDKRPMLSDLRESGSIEQDADVVMFVFREEFYNKDDDSLKGEAEVIVAKQRNGPTQTVKLTWMGEFTRFENRAFREESRNFGDYG